MRVGTEEHKILFCNDFISSFAAFEPETLPWPELDEVSLARLRAIPIWTMALEVELSAGSMLYGFAATEPDPLVRKALEMQAFEEDRHGRLLQYMIQRYGLVATPGTAKEPPTREAFIAFGYTECVDSFAGFGIFKLACDSRILPDSLTSIFSRILVEEARHIVFFINWIAWDRYRRGYGADLVQWLPALLGYATAIVRRVKGSGDFTSGTGDNLNLFSDVMEGLTPAKFILTCLAENERYMLDRDPRLLRPRVIPAIARFALAVIELIETLRDFLAGPQTQAPASPEDVPPPTHLVDGSIQRREGNGTVYSTK
jgi:hypothetical protein